MALAITLAEYDIETGRLLRLVAEDYHGPWALAKNDKSKEAAKDAKAASAKAQATADAQLRKSNELIDKVATQFEAQLRGEGVSEEEIALRISQFLNSVSRNAESGRKQVRQQVAQRGGYEPGGFGGPDIGKLAGYEGEIARTRSAGVLGTKLWASEENWKRKLGAGTLYGALAGTQAQTATGFGNIGLGYSGVQQQAAASADKPSPLWGVLEKAIGGASSIGTAGVACWIAEAIYGPLDFRTHLLRHWLNFVWAKQSIIGAATMSLYRLCGRWVAHQPLLVRMLKPLFDRALAAALRN